MKKLFYLLIGVMLMTASCSNDSDADLITGLEKNQNDMQNLVNDKAKGTYNMVWIVDKQVVGEAMFSTVLDPHYYVITHFPMECLYLYSSEDGILANHPVHSALDVKMTYNYQSYWYLNTSYVGFSNNNAYLANDSWNPRTYFTVNEQERVCQLWINTEQGVGKQTTLMYDTEKDVWSGTVPIDSFTVIDVNTQESKTWRRSTNPLNLSFQTTGRKK